MKKKNIKLGKDNKNLTPNQKREETNRKLGSKIKKKGHKREEDFKREFNPSTLNITEYGATSDCSISLDHPIIKSLKETFGNLESFNTSNKSGNSIQFTLGRIDELNIDNNLEFIQDKKNSKLILNKYLKKDNSKRPVDLLVYKNKNTKKWEFFHMNDVIEYISDKCIWRKLDSGRLKGDFNDLSKKGKRQYLTYEYRKKHKSFFLGINGGKGLEFINLLKSEIGINYYSEPY